MEFLGYVISKDGIRMDLTKINYKIHDKEFIAIVMPLRNVARWRWQDPLGAGEDVFPRGGGPREQAWNFMSRRRLHSLGRLSLRPGENHHLRRVIFKDSHCPRRANFEENLWILSPWGRFFLGKFNSTTFARETFCFQKWCCQKVDVAT